VQNRRIVIESRPLHNPTESNLRFESREIDLEGASLQEGEILVKTLWVSLDPYLRAPLGLPGDEARPAAIQLSQFKDSRGITAVGELFGGRGAGRVLKSRNPKVAPGDLVAADWKWEEYATFNPDQELTFEKLESDLFTADNEKGKHNISTALGALGVSGSHAYYGLTQALSPKAGETLVVSSAAGNIGIVVGQLGKIHNLKTVGIAGGPEKVNKLVSSKAFDAGVDYKAANGDVAALSKKLKEVCPNGIDLYYDNARGFISDAVSENLNPGARVYVCGGVANYNKGDRINPYGDIKPIEGVTISTGLTLGATYLNGIPHARAEIARSAKEGKFEFFEHVTEGFENIPKAFVAMYEGQNFGKTLVKV